MKTLLTLITALFTVGLASAQYCGNSGPAVCSPTGTQTSSGLFPASENLPSFINGAQTSTVIQFKNFDTISFSGQVINVQTLRFDSISNLPQGLCWATSQANNTYANQQDGCIVISGTPCATPGQYKLYIIATMDIGFEIQTNMEAAGMKYFLRVKNSGEIDAVVDTTQTTLFLPYGPSPNCQIGPPVVSAGSNQTVCNGSNVTLSPSLSGGLAPYTYTWSATGDALSCSVCRNPSVTITQNSTYNVTVVDANNNSTTGSVSYSVGAGNNSMQVTTTNTGITCLSQQGSSVATVTGGTAPFIYNNGNGSTTNSSLTTATFQYAQPNDYVVSVTDANGCVSSALSTITYTGVVVNYINAVHPDCENTSNGQVEAVATGGTPPYTFYWSNNVQTATLTNQPANTYYLSVTDAADCLIHTSYNLYPTNGWGPHASLYTTPDNCSSSTGSIVNQTYGGTAPFNFSWSNGSTVQNLDQIVTGTYNVTVTDALGCSSTATSQVQNHCISLIQGTIFKDLNSDCTFDAGDSVLGNIPVAAVSNAHTYYGYAVNGTYSVQVSSTGAYQISPYISNGSCIALSTCSGGLDTVDVLVLGDTIENQNFGYNSSGPSFDLSMHPGWTNANPGFMKKYWIFPYAYGVVSGPATIVLKYDSNLVYQSSESPLPVHDPIGHTLTWVLNSVPQNGFNNAYRLENTFYVPLTVSVGDLLNTEYSISPMSGDCNPADNQYIFSETVTGSHDPNEKIVSPEGAIFEEDSILTYTIGFQNTGTDSTWFVIILDTLSNYLDARTVTNIASSHPYSSFSISGEGILKWIFDPLRLVDSATNEPGSNGFVMFTIKKKPHLPIGTTISNTASVYFDYNEAVVTNTVYDSLALPNYIFDVKGDDGISVKAMPNPFSQSTNIVIDGLNEKYTFELFSLTGKLTRKVEVQNGNGFTLQRNDLAAGIYTYKINSATGKSAFGKLVVK